MIKLPADMLARLQRTYGLDDSVLSEPGCLVAAHHRMRVLGVHDEPAYLKLLEGSREEFEAFVDELLVPESWFFRDRAPFDFLANWVQSSWRGKQGDGRLLRVLSVPCASGPEPYSIAMTLLDAGLSAKDFRVYAGDVSERSLARARLGEYRAMAFRGKDAEGRRHHFEPLENGGMRVRERVRQCVSFKRCNLLDPATLAFAPSFDVVFCRNVLIYFCAEARRRVVGYLQKLLACDGLFFVGHADGLPMLSDAFESMGPSGAFCYQQRAIPAADASADKATTTASRFGGRSTARASAIRPTKTTRAKGPAKPAAAKAPSASDANHATTTNSREDHAQSAAAAVEAIAASLQTSAKLADAGQLEAARENCLEHLQAHPPSAEALFLLGQIEMASSRLREAEVCIRKALYLNPNHHEAILLMALLAERRGAMPEAERLRARARKLEGAAHV